MAELSACAAGKADQRLCAGTGNGRKGERAICYAIIEVAFRGDRGPPQTKRVEAADQLPARIKECQALPEAIKVKVFVYQDHTSTERVEEWRSRALMQRTDELASNDVRRQLDVPKVVGVAG